MASARKHDINGWMEVHDNPISKVGVFQYSGRSIGAPDPDRMYNVYRPEEELNNPETIASFKLLPFINDHPADMLGSSLADLPTVDGKPAEGVIGEKVYFEFPYLLGNLKFFTDRIAKAIDAGKREVSAGFRCMYEKAAGNFNGEPYEYVQRKIRGNHVALVEAGRMGPEVAVLDHLILTFDSKELIKMTDPVKTDPATPAKDADGEMTLAEITATIKAIGPQIKALTDAMAALSGAPAAPAAEPVIDANGTEPAAPAAPAADADPAAPAADPVKAMDAMEKRVKALEAIVKPTKALDAKDVMVAIGNRDKLYTGVSRIIGAFDHSEMDAQGIAAYAAKKLNIEAPAGTEIVAVNAYLAAKAPAAPKPAAALDAKDPTVSPIRKHVNQE
jgi:hypothetical protein